MDRMVEMPGYLEWIAPKYLAIQWKPDGMKVEGGNLPTPHREITAEEFDTWLHHSGGSLAGVNYYGNVTLPDADKSGSLWAWQAWFYFFRDHALAITSRYMHQDEWDSGEWQHGLGRFLIDGQRRNGNHGYAERFWRIGCEHPFLRELSPEETRAKGMRHYGSFDHVYWCDDCGATWSTDSSG